MNSARGTAPPSTMYSLSSKLVGFTIVLVVVPGVIFAWLSLTAIRKPLESSYGQRLVEVAQDVASEMSDLVVRERLKLRGWAHQFEIQGGCHGELRSWSSTFLKAQIDGNPAFVALECLDGAGRSQVGAHPPSDPEARPNVEGIAGALRGEDVVTAPDSPSDAATVIDIFVPIRNALRPPEIVGVLHGSYDWDRGQAPPAHEQQNHFALGLTADILILNAQGVVVAEGIPNSGVSFLGRDLRAAGWESAQAPIAKHGGQYGIEHKASLLAGYYPLTSPFDGWLAVAVQPVESALAPVFRLRRRLLLLLLSVGLVAIGVALAIADRMTRPLRALARAISNVATNTEIHPMAVPSRDEIGAVAMAFNLMASKLEQAREDLVRSAKLAFIGEVAAGVAHEIRTPLGILRTSAQILGRSEVQRDPQASELIDAIVDEVDRLDRVVDGLLQIARPHTPQIDNVPLASILSRVAEFVAAQADEHGITLICELNTPQPPARCDSEQIYQVALNLVVNALSALQESPTQPRRLLLRCTEEHEGRVGFEVCDNGPGIAPELHERIFTPYLTMRKGGTGLGLALVQRVVQAHKGTVKVKSEVGHGACFRVELPVAMVAVESRP